MENQGKGGQKNDKVSGVMNIFKKLALKKHRNMMCMTIFMNISWVLKNTNFKTQFQVLTDKLKSYAQ